MKRALVLSLICVVGLAFAGFGQTLTGSWVTSVCIDPQTAFFAPGTLVGTTSSALTLTSTLGVTYAIGDWAFTSTTVLNASGWYDQDFSVTGLFGLITVSSGLGFTVPTGGFDKWTTTLGLNMAGVSFGATFQLGGTGVGGAKLTLTGAAGVGSAVAGDVTVVLGNALTADCDFDFVSVNIGLDFLFCDCLAIASDIYFSCLNGFEYVKFAATGIVIPNIPWLTLNAELKFQLQTKELKISPVFDLGAFVCVDLYIYGEEGLASTYPSASYSFGGFGGFTLEGIGISCDIGGVTFSALSNWHAFTSVASRPGALAGKHMGIWEVYSIDVSADACCGGLFEFGLDVFFADSWIIPAYTTGTPPATVYHPAVTVTNTNLFDVAAFEADLKVNITTQFAFTMGLNIDVAGGFTQWCVGFDVTW